MFGRLLLAYFTVVLDVTGTELMDSVGGTDSVRGTANVVGVKGAPRTVGSGIGAGGGGSNPTLKHFDPYGRYGVNG